MNWDACVDRMLCLNLGTREDRRLTAWAEFAAHGLEVERFPAVNKAWLKRLRGYASSGRYGCSLSQRLALRRAMRNGTKGLLLLEDDAVLHPEFAVRIRELPLPDDWAMLYLGCQHLSGLRKPSAGGEAETCAIFHFPLIAQQPQCMRFWCADGWCQHADYDSLFLLCIPLLLFPSSPRWFWLRRYPVRRRCRSCFTIRAA